MKHVERAVRPVVAPHSQKMRMRNELLAHLMELYREELDRGCEPAGAVENATDRLGQPAILREKLQGEIAQVDRVLARIGQRLEGVIQRRGGELPVGHAARLALIGGTSFGIAVAFVVAVLIPPIQGWSELPFALYFSLGLGIVSFSILFSTIWLGYAVFRRFQAPISGVKICHGVVLTILGCAAIGMGARAMLWAWFTRELSMAFDRPNLTLHLLADNVAFTLFFAVMMAGVLAESRRSAPWLGLHIGP